MALPEFIYYSGEDTLEEPTYYTKLWIPNIDPPDAGRKIRSTIHETLDNGVFIVSQSNGNSLLTPGKYTLSWAVCDSTFYDLAYIDFSEGNLVNIVLTPRIATAVTSRILEFNPKQIGGGLTSLSLVIQEV